MTLLQTEIATPVGKLNIIADQHVVLAANLSSIKSLRESLGEEDFGREIKSVSIIPVISQLISDYFDGDVNALNAIAVRQPGGAFSQSAWKAMKKIKPGNVISYADLARRRDFPLALLNLHKKLHSPV